MNFEPGARIGAYQLVQHCGGGAYGEVFVARNVLTNERLALKVLHASSPVKKRELSGLVRYCGCRHPHLIRIFHVEEAGDRFYYTMELADDLNEGQGPYVPATLAALLEKRGRLPADEVEALGNALSAALKALHEKGLVHRDVKPANILFVRGEPVLGDPGLTAGADGNSLAGTPEFMSPELLQKKRGSALPEDDFYALRRVLYCAFTGEGPAEFPHCPAGLLDERSSGLWRKILDAENFSAGPEDAPRPRSVYRRPLLWVSVAVLALAALTAALFLFRPSPPPREAASPPDLAELLRRYSDDEAECEKFRLPAEKRFEEHFDSFRAEERSLAADREANRITPAEFAIKKGELGRLHVERKRRDPLLRLRDTQQELQNELAWLAAAEAVSGPVAAKQSLIRVAELFRKRHALLAELRKKQSPSSLLSK